MNILRLCLFASLCNAPRAFAGWPGSGRARPNGHVDHKKQNGNNNRPPRPNSALIPTKKSAGSVGLGPILLHLPANALNSYMSTTNLFQTLVVLAALRSLLPGVEQLFNNNVSSPPKTMTQQQQGKTAIQTTKAIVSSLKTKGPPALWLLASSCFWTLAWRVSGWFWTFAENAVAGRDHHAAAAGGGTKRAWFRLFWSAVLMVPILATGPEWTASSLSSSPSSPAGALSKTKQPLLPSLQRLDQGLRLWQLGAIALNLAWGVLHLGLSNEFY